MGRGPTYFNTRLRPSLTTATAAPKRTSSSRDAEAAAAKEEGAGGGGKRRRRKRQLETPPKRPCLREEEEEEDDGAPDPVEREMPADEGRGGRRHAEPQACPARNPHRAPAGASGPAAALPRAPRPASTPLPSPCPSPVCAVATRQEPAARAAAPRGRLETAGRGGWREEARASLRGKPVERETGPPQHSPPQTRSPERRAGPAREARAAQTEEKWPDVGQFRREPDRPSAADLEASLRKIYDKRMEQLKFQESVNIEQIKEQHQREIEKLAEGHQQELEEQREDFEGELLSSIDQLCAKHTKALQHEQNCTAQARSNTKRLEERSCALEAEIERLKATFGQIDARLAKYVNALQGAFPSPKAAHVSQPVQHHQQTYHVYNANASL